MDNRLADGPNCSEMERRALWNIPLRCGYFAAKRSCSQGVTEPSEKPRHLPQRNKVAKPQRKQGSSRRFGLPGPWEA